MTIGVQDTEYDDLLIHLPNACQFIQAALDEGGKVLVHCVMGVSRSATVICAFCEYSLDVVTQSGSQSWHLIFFFISDAVSPYVGT